MIFFQLLGQSITLSLQGKKADDCRRNQQANNYRQYDRTPYCHIHRVLLGCMDSTPRLNLSPFSAL